MKIVRDETVLAKLRQDGLNAVAVAAMVRWVARSHPNLHVLHANVVPVVLSITQHLRRSRGVSEMVQLIGILSVKHPETFAQWYVNMFDRHFSQLDGEVGAECLLNHYLNLTTSELFQMDLDVLAAKDAR